MRVLALDYGSARCGVAVSDPSETIATPLEPVLAAGTKVPSFTLTREDAEKLTQEDLQGVTTIFVFYPFAFSPVCTDQLQLYDGLLDDLAARGVYLYGVSCDSTWAQTAFREKLDEALR